MGCCPTLINSNQDKAQPIHQKSSASIPLPFRPSSRQQTFSLNLKPEADALKEKGNKCFKEGNYQEALKYYNYSIIKYPLDPVYFTNQAMCLKKMGRWEQALQSANKALKLDSVNPKAKLHKAVCLAELSKTQSSSKVKISQAEQSHQILVFMKGREPFAREVDELIEKILLLRQIYWQEEEKEKEGEFREYLLKKISHNPLTEALKPHYRKQKDLSDEITKFIQKEHQLNECPQYFQDPITYQLFRTPFLCPSGITYEKQLLLDHVKVNGPKDPTTKQDFTKKQPVVNKQLMTLVQTDQNVTKWRKIQKQPMNAQFINL